MAAAGPGAGAAEDAFLTFYNEVRYRPCPGSCAPGGAGPGRARGPPAGGTGPAAMGAGGRAAGAGGLVLGPALPQPRCREPRSALGVLAVPARRAPLGLAVGELSPGRARVPPSAGPAALGPA